MRGESVLGLSPDLSFVEPAAGPRGCDDLGREDPAPRGRCDRHGGRPLAPRPCRVQPARREAGWLTSPKRLSRRASSWIILRAGPGPLGESHGRHGVQAATRPLDAVAMRPPRGDRGTPSATRGETGSAGRRRPRRSPVPCRRPYSCHRVRRPLSNPLPTPSRRRSRTRELPADRGARARGGWAQLVHGHPLIPPSCSCLFQSFLRKHGCR